MGTLRTLKSGGYTQAVGSVSLEDCDTGVSLVSRVGSAARLGPQRLHSLKPDDLL